MAFDNLFEATALTAALNNIVTPVTLIWDRYFRGHEVMRESENIWWDVIDAPQRILANQANNAPMVSSEKTTRTIRTLRAPRLTDAKVITAYEINSLRAFGGEMNQFEQLKDIIARETLDARNAFDRTLEFWGTKLISELKIFDADGMSVLYEYAIPSGHDDPTATENPLTDLQGWKLKIIQDSFTNITGWDLLVGQNVLADLLDNIHVREAMRYQMGQNLLAGTIPPISGCEIIPVTNYYMNGAGTWTPYMDQDTCVLVGKCADMVEVPYAPPIQFTSGDGVPPMFYAGSEQKLNPAGWHMYFETRPLPVLKRPGCLIVAQPNEWAHPS